MILIDIEFDIDIDTDTDIDILSGTLVSLDGLGSKA